MLGRRSNHAQIINTYLTEHVDRIKKTDINIFSDDLEILTYDKALLNATKLYLLSGRWDRVRQPGWAGFFDNLLREYPMNADGEKKVVEDLTENIKNKIAGVNITEVTAKANVISRSWDVGVSAIDTETNVYIDSKKNADENFITVSQSENMTIGDTPVESAKY